MMTGNDHTLRHQAQRTAADADQTEFSALLNGSSVVDTGIHDEQIAEALDDFSAADPNLATGWQQNDLNLEAAVGQIRTEIERRDDLLGPHYPFRIKGNSLHHEPSEHFAYEFFLAICNAPNLTTGRHVCLPRVFERISACLVAGFFGARSTFLHTGSPRDPEVGKSFKKAMQTLAERTSEWVWGPESGLPDSPAGGDAGMDFVVWPKFTDRRSIGQLFILGQCACGNNWDTKLHDLSVKDLAKWFNPPWVVDPVRCFTTPFHVTDAMLKEASRKAGVIFDRVRLVGIDYDTGHSLIKPEMRQAMQDLIELVRNP
jgi:hypothetical protein